MFVIVTCRSGFRAQWNSVFRQIAHKSKEVLVVEDSAQLKAARPAESAALVVIDFAVPGISDPLMLKQLHRVCGDARLLIAGAAFDSQTELAALACGVVGACHQDLQMAALTRIVSVVLQGGIWVSSTSLPLLIGRLQGLNSPVSCQAMALDTPKQLLTVRELEIAELVSSGASNKKIAYVLNISEQTVKSHLSTIFAKLKVTSRLGLALRMTKNDHASS